MPEMTEAEIKNLINEALQDYAKTSNLNNYAKKIEARIVSDDQGDIVSTKGTIQAKDMYTFYAVMVDKTDKQEVAIVLPIGGPQSGLYRFPRVGEKVLVDNVSGIYYLLGYVPSVSDSSIIPDDTTYTDAEIRDIIAKPQADRTEEEKKKLAASKETKKLQDEGKGMVLRYQQTGKEAPSSYERYSEIGFYQETAAFEDEVTKKEEKDTWPSKNYVKYGKEPLEEESKLTKSYGYPLIDHIKIKSTGDISSDAQDRHLFSANRFEILADAPKIDHVTGKTIADEELPLGDLPGDEYKLENGDIQIRAAGSVVIKALKEIVLKVGRTTLSISDSGFSVVTKKINSNWDIGFDTSLNLDPRSGISMFGQTVDISSGHSLSLGDKYGGSLEISTGTISVTGKEVGLSTCNTVKYGLLLAFNAWDYGLNTALASYAIQGEDPADKEFQDKINAVNWLIKKIVQFFKKLYFMLPKFIKVYKNAKADYTLAKESKNEQEEKEKAKKDMEDARKDMEDAKNKIEVEEKKLTMDKTQRESVVNNNPPYDKMEPSKRNDLADKMEADIQARENNLNTNKTGLEGKIQNYNNAVKEYNTKSEAFEKREKEIRDAKEKREKEEREDKERKRRAKEWEKDLR